MSTTTTSTFLIPLTNVSQQFTINLANVNYTLTVKWNDQPDAGWILDIADANDNTIVTCIPLTTGTDILSGLGYLNFGGTLTVVTTGASPMDVPTYANLGTDCNLFFTTSTTS